MPILTGYVRCAECSYNRMSFFFQPAMLVYHASNEKICNVGLFFLSLNVKMLLPAAIPVNSGGSATAIDESK